MRVILLILLGLLVFCMAVGAVAFHHFGVKGLLGAIVALIVLGYLGLRLCTRLLPMIFLAKVRKQMEQDAAVLRGAAVEVHSIEPAPEPDEDDWGMEPDEPEFDPDDEEEDDESLDKLLYRGPRDWYYLDLTITPRETAAGDEDAEWEPECLSLFGPPREPDEIRELAGEIRSGFPLGDLAEQFLLEDGFCRTAEVRLWQDGKFRSLDDLFELEDDRIIGPQRLQMHVGIKPDARLLRLLYHDVEVLAEIALDHP